MQKEFQKRKESFFSFKEQRRRLQQKKKKGLVSCRRCGRSFSKEEWRREAYVCRDCGYHMPLSGRARLALLLDQGSFSELYPNLCSEDPLNFPDYAEKRREAEKKSGLKDALYGGYGRIDGMRALVAVLDSSYMMGSMGTAVGEKLALFAERAKEERLPLIIFSASGGARMQEGLFSLMQMAKTAAAIGSFREEGGLFISVLTHPTTGGVSASFASLGDIILAEKEALIGFAGPRVIRQTIGQELPEGFQRAEFQEQHGFVDRVLNRNEIKGVISNILRIHGQGQKQ